LVDPFSLSTERLHIRWLHGLEMAERELRLETQQLGQLNLGLRFAA
jgi:hypothetical protein